MTRACSVRVDEYIYKISSLFRGVFRAQKSQQDPSIGEVFQRSFSGTAASVSVRQFKISLFVPETER